MIMILTIEERHTDVFHFICVCPCYSDLRRRFLKSQYYIRPSVHKFNQLMSSDVNLEILNLVKFIKLSLDIRNSINIESVNN